MRAGSCGRDSGQQSIVLRAALPHPDTIKVPDTFLSHLNDASNRLAKSVNGLPAGNCGVGYAKESTKRGQEQPTFLPNAFNRRLHRLQCLVRLLPVDDLVLAIPTAIISSLRARSAFSAVRMTFIKF